MSAHRRLVAAVAALRRPGRPRRGRAGPARPARAAGHDVRARDPRRGALARPHRGRRCCRTRSAGCAPVRRTFAELAADVHRAANALAELGVQRGEAVALLSVNCAELLPALLAAETVGIAAPINPALSADHATELVRLAGARVIVAAGPELDPVAWERARRIARRTGARALLALRPTAPQGAPPALAPLGATDVAYLAERVAAADPRTPAFAPPESTDIASYLHTGGTTGTPKLAARTHANEVANAWMITCVDLLHAGRHDVRGAAAVSYQRPAGDACSARCSRASTCSGRGRSATATWPCTAASGGSSSTTASPTMSAVPTVYAGLAQVPVDADISSLVLADRRRRAAAAGRARRLRGPYRRARCARATGSPKATCASARSWPGRAAPWHRRPAPALPAGEPVAIDEATGGWTSSRRARPARSCCAGPNVFAGYLVAPARRPASCTRTARSATAGSTPATSARSTRTGSSTSPAAPRT